MKIEDYANLIVRGGWPGLIGNSEDVYRRQIPGYCNAVVKSDITTVDGVLRAIVLRDERKVTSILRSYARLTGSQASSHDLLFDPITFGLLFKSLVIRDLKIYSQTLRGHGSHDRDKSGLEADAIIHLSDGRWAAIDVKLGTRQVDEAAKNLLALKERIDINQVNPPSFLMIVTGTEFVYQRKDVFMVVPLGYLRP